MTTKVEKTIRVDQPISTVYNQWTQFEEFPHFMGGIKKITQLDDRRLHWVAEIAGVKREWDAKILEQIADEKIAWAATDGATNAGAVYFTPAGPNATTVKLCLEYEPEGIVESIGDKLNIVEKQAESDLEKFKSFIEDAGYASGAWRGNISPSSVGTPTIADAQESRGDDGKAGLSLKTVAAAAAGAAAVGVAMAKKKSGEQPSETDFEAVDTTYDADAVVVIDDDDDATVYPVDATIDPSYGSGLDAGADAPGRTNRTI